jgi:DMSO/TMAO reductase YedYZ molybdopterin-dependent catalytic subunit
MSRGETGENDSRRDRYLRRRRFLMAAGSLAGVGVVAGGAAGDDGSASMQENNTTNATQEGGPEPLDPTVPVRNIEGVGIADRFTGLRVLAETPANAEAAIREPYTDFITPAEDHYIRNHYPTPEIDAGEWTISVTGLSDGDSELSIEALRTDYSTETVTHTMQCSGNGRSYFEPQVGGNQWTYGAVGNTVWTGAPVREILEQFDVDTSPGRYVSFMGGDAPEDSDIFTRSIPMRKVLEDTILAYEMNGSPMYPEHGYPVRVVVPGWYGNNCVKWVERMHVMDRMVTSPEWEQYVNWQQSSYRLVWADAEQEENETIDEFDIEAQMASEGGPLPYIYDQIVKSIIGFPGEGATVEPGPGGEIEVLGVAWAGDDEVERVEVSMDGGETWNDAEFFGPSPGPAAWRQFRYVWDAEPGDYAIYSRATDELGRTQPATISDPDDGLTEIANDQYPWNQGGYCATAYEPHGVQVTVTETGATANETAPGGNETAGNVTAGNETAGNVTAGNATGNQSGD